ncbi:MAG: hypothetical protein DYG93_07745 [Leptolyngbya sp. PLA2]|nr:hypothetical protein [Leptolyngbya sp.]MCE7971540.1 hypothetical protein [Leptolyngbya sp. PL-A2]MCQ3940754.1 hypothetical protein [cyanobacterium CYA1]MDL1903724.1 hypothetical protein [Synechococcales cyanobacterium CNB]
MTTNAEHDRTKAIGYARFRFQREAEWANQNIREKIAWCRRNLDEAERRLDQGEMPNTCGILQSSAFELEMAVARLAAIRDLAPAIESLAKDIAAD